MTLCADIQVWLTDIWTCPCVWRARPVFFCSVYLPHSHGLILYFSIDYFPKMSKLFGIFSYLQVKNFIIAWHHVIVN